jgi:transcriptional regulator with XRE-family HTH domain
MNMFWGWTSMRQKKKPVDPVIGRRLADVRKRRKLTQGALAKKLGVDVSTIKDWEHGRTALSTGRIAQLARSLECSPGDLWEPVGAAVRTIAEGI